MILEHMREMGHPVSPSQCRKLMGINRATRLFGLLESDREIEHAETVRRGGHAVELFRLSGGVSAGQSVDTE